MKRYSLFVAGLGAIGLKYDLRSPVPTVLTHTKAALTHTAFRLVGGADPTPGARRVFRSVAGQDAFASIDHAVRAGVKADVVVLATPPSGRLPLVRASLGLNPRLMLIEKPISLHLNEARACLALCRRAGVAVAVNYFRRFDPVLAGLPTLGRRWGRIRALQVLYTGGLVGNGSHFVDLVLRWCGRPDRCVRTGPVQPWANEDGQVPFRLIFRGVAAEFLPLSVPYGFCETDVFFERGRIRMTDYGERLLGYESGPDPLFSGYRRLRLVHGLPQPERLRCQLQVLDGLADFLDKGTPLPSSGATALQTLGVCRKVLGS